ncbi:MAG TPA: DUF6602 domain-containing protein [Candidatus Hypogeohydataceae bacterium YC41]
MDTNSKTQEDIIDKIGGVIKNKQSIQDKNERKKWNRYVGDVCCRIFREFILKYLPQNYTVSYPNAYIIGFPTEFDLLILNKDTKPDKYTNAFRPEKVRCVFEIKARGINVGREGLEKEITKIKNKFEEVRKKYSHISFLYLTYREVNKTKRAGSIKYLDETRKILGPDNVFCLKDSRSGETNPGEWDRLINRLTKILQ